MSDDLDNEFAMSRLNNTGCGGVIEDYFSENNLYDDYWEMIDRVQDKIRTEI
jgi:hypothetical protein